MNTGNSIHPARGSSHEMPPGDHNSLNSELEINKQSEPSTSTSKDLIIKIPKSIGNKRRKEVSLGKDLLDSMESLSNLIEPYIYEQNIKKSRLLDIKVACETLAEELNGRILTDKDVIDTLNSVIASDKQTSDKKKASKAIGKFEKTLEKFSRKVQMNFAGDKHFVDVLEEFTESKIEFISGKNDIESLCKDIKTLLDTMLRPVTS